MGIWLPRNHRRIAIVGDKSALTVPGIPSDYVSQVKRIVGPSLIGFWPLNETSGAVAADKGGRGHNGAYTGVTFLVPGQELLSNTGFETVTAVGPPADFANWLETTAAGSSIEVSNTAHGGSNSAKVIRNVSDAAEIYQTMTTIPWARYRQSFWAQGDGTNSGRYKAGPSGAITSMGVTATEWAQVVNDFQATGTTLYYSFLSPAADGAFCLVDDCQFYAIQPNGIRGMCAPYYDGTNDYSNIYSAALASAFNGDEFTISVWVRVSGAGVWTDGVYHRAIWIAADGNNRVSMQKSASDNTWELIRGGSSTWKSVSTASGGTLGWTMLTITASKSRDEQRHYVNAAQAGDTETGLASWSGAPAATTTVIGAASTTPTQPWSGLIGPTLVATRVLSPGEIRALYQASLPVAA